MEVKTISYKRVNNLGSYSNEHLEMFAELNSNDDARQCAAELKTRVETALDLNKPEAKPTPAPKTNHYDKNPW